MTPKGGWFHFTIRAGLIGLVLVACSSKYRKDRATDGAGGTSGGEAGETATLTNGTSAGGVTGTSATGTMTGTSVSSGGMNSTTGFAVSTSDGGTAGSAGVSGNGGVGGIGGVAGAGGTDPMACTADQRDCQGACVALDACCGNEECPSGESCQDNECTCNQGSKRCDDACIPETACCSDEDCPTGATCADAECSCGAGTHQCGDSCASDSSVDTCGIACDEPCTAPIGGDVDCDGAQCIPSCPSGQMACVGECIDDNNVCDGSCPGGTHDCAGVCLPNTSLLACGDSCSACPAPSNASATCDGTDCDFECDQDFSRCGSECIPEGACCDADDCGAGVICVDNQCACSTGSKLCDGACIDDDACCDSAECQPNAVCNGSNSCQCDTNFQNCDGQCIANSACCEANDCGNNEVCASGACTCAPNFKQCTSSGPCVSDASCCGDGDCPGNASCEDSSCECDSDYFGTDCDYYFVGLGFLSGDTYSEARGVSADGSSVVGASRTGSAGAPTAFRWKNGTLTNLGVLGGESIAYATSSDGSVVVGDGRLDATHTVGFRWSSNTITALDLASYGTYSTARDISDDGSVIVGWGDRDAEHRGLVWTNLVVATRGSIDPLYFNAVTPSGSIYAGKMFSTPMTYQSSETQLGLLNGYTGGEVLTLTASGSTRGAGFLNGGTNDRAVRWTLGGEAVDVGTLSGASRALAISADGSVIVGVSNNQAFIWDSSNGIRALTTVLSNAGVDLDDWVLQSATGISANGKTVAGYGAHGGTTEAFVATLP